MANIGIRCGYPARFFQSINVSPALITANTVSHETYTVNGLYSDMAIHIVEPVRQAGIQMLGGRVTGVNSLEVDWWNTTGGSITPTAGQELQVVGF